MTYVSSKARWRNWGWRLLPGGLATLAVTLLTQLGLFQPLEQLSYQSLFLLRGKQPWDERLVLIAIDDTSLAQLGRFPWNRQRYVKLLNLLSPVEPNLVAFDLLFSEPSPDDQQLAAAMQQHGHVILAQAWDANGAPLLPVASLRQNSLGVGHIATGQESDGIVRQVRPQIRSVPALGLVAAQAYSLTQTPVVLPQTNAPLWLNWVGDAASLPRYSFADVVQGKVPLQAFQNKIILVGVTAIGIDPSVTPFDRNPPASSVMLHATLIQNLLHRSALRPLGMNQWVLLLLLGGPILSWYLHGRSWPKQVAAIAGLWAAWILFSVGLLNSNILVPVAVPLTLVLLSGSITGIADRLRESATLQRQLDQIRQQEVLQEEFFRTASHELRTPVANIQSAVALLRIAKSPADWEEYLQILEEECRQESALINDLLDFQRLDSIQPLELETHNLREWLSEVLLPFSLRAKTEQQQLLIRIESDYPDLKLDWNTLRRILTELLNNACKYTPAQEVIQVTVKTAAQQLHLVISNSGVTIPANELEKIFEPFYRVPEVDQRQQGGTGLGLSIVKRLVEHQGGVIRVTNQAQVVSFTICLPIPAQSVAVSS
jgi:signal transduction histidine kinase